MELSKQAGREWYILVDSFLKELGFKPNRADHCFYTLVISAIEYVLLLLLLMMSLLFQCLMH